MSSPIPRNQARSQSHRTPNRTNVSSPAWKAAVTSSCKKRIQQIRDGARTDKIEEMRQKKGGAWLDTMIRSELSSWKHTQRAAMERVMPSSDPFMQEPDDIDYGPRPDEEEEDLFELYNEISSELEQLAAPMPTETCAHAQRIWSPESKIETCKICQQIVEEPLAHREFPEAVQAIGSHTSYCSATPSIEIDGSAKYLFCVQCSTVLVI